MPTSFTCGKTLPAVCAATDNRFRSHAVGLAQIRTAWGAQYCSQTWGIWQQVGLARPADQATYCREISSRRQHVGWGHPTQASRAATSEERFYQAWCFSQNQNWPPSRWAATMTNVECRINDEARMTKERAGTTGSACGFPNSGRVKSTSGALAEPVAAQQKNSCVLRLFCFPGRIQNEARSRTEGARQDSPGQRPGNADPK
jgi:hypothetical protein